MQHFTVVVKMGRILKSGQPFNPTRINVKTMVGSRHNSIETISRYMAGSRRREISLALNKDFDTRWIGELPIVFDGTIEQCADYAISKGYHWIECGNLLFGGCFEHPTEPLALYPV